MIPTVDPEPIVLPTPAPPARRPPLPLVAAVVPVAAAGVMWLVTGSAMMLLFAALGPLIAVATVIDGSRANRRERRRVAAETAAALAQGRRALQARHADERAARWAVAPDVGTLLQRPADIWRGLPERGDALVVGSGEGASTARITGGGDEGDAAALRRAAGILTETPVTIPAHVGLCVVGPLPLALAVARGLVMQLCLTHPPDRLALVRAPAAEGWAAELPHRRGRGMRVAYCGPGERAPDDADVVIAVAAAAVAVPRQCGATLALTGSARAELEHGARRQAVTVEGFSQHQAVAIATQLAAAARAAAPAADEARLGDLLAEASDRDGLAVPVGHGEDGALVVDLVADGPHAVVAGVTGSGKSELLVTWVTALCATRSPGEVCFLLADFKGGTAFDRLAALPHVTGVLTDLDGDGAQRAIHSLRAELRRREGELARTGARDIHDPQVEMPRLVIIVDEFAALLADHPDLHAVFTDIAARGRALGMHLVLGTQRVGGVVRDALLANCPLRICLRVTDAADSRAVVGTDEAALLPGDTTSRGLALVRRAGDTAPRVARIALTRADELDEIRARRAHERRPHPPWLPALPARIPLSALRAHDDAAPGPARLLLGLADEPERQSQPLVHLQQGADRGLVVVGGPGSGKTSLVELLAAQATPETVVHVPVAAEDAWDAVEALVRRPRAGTLVLVDDLDALAAAFAPDYAAAWAERLERAVRTAGAHGTTFVLTAQRLAGPVARIAELLPLRAILPMPTRLDHVTAGGDPAAFDPNAAAGRATLGRRTVQLAVADTSAAARPAADSTTAPPDWRPRGEVTALATRSARAHAAALAEAMPACRVRRLDELPSAARLDDVVDAGHDVLVVGDPDGWQRQWGLWSAVRTEGDVVVSVSCAGEFRALTGLRELPPYAQATEDRAWLVGASGAAVRVRIPAPEMY